MTADKWRRTSNLEEGKILKFTRAIESLVKYFDKKAENFERVILSSFDKWMGDSGKSPISEKKYSALRLLKSLLGTDELDSPLSTNGSKSKNSPVSAIDLSNPYGGRSTVQPDFPSRNRRNKYADIPFEMISEEPQKPTFTIPSVENFGDFDKKSPTEPDSVRKRARFQEDSPMEEFVPVSRARRKQTATDEQEFTEMNNNPQSGGYSMKLNSQVSPFTSKPILKNHSTEECDLLTRSPADRMKWGSEQAIDTEIKNRSKSPNQVRKGIKREQEGSAQDLDEPIVTRERRQVGFNLVNPLTFFIQQPENDGKSKMEQPECKSATFLKWPSGNSPQNSGLKLDLSMGDESSPLPKSVFSSGPTPQNHPSSPRKLTGASEKEDMVSVTSMGQEVRDGVIRGEETTSSFPPPTRNRRKGTLESLEKPKETKPTAFEDLERNFNKFEDFLHRKRNEVRRKTKMIKLDSTGIFSLQADNERLVMSDTEADKRRKIRLQYEEKQKESMTATDFDFLALLGKGGFGTVWLVRRKATGDYYALKIIKFHNKSQDFIESMIKENKIMMSLVGDYVVKGVFSFVYLSYYCVVMDLMVGGDFQKLLAERGAFYEEEARFYAAELALAVNHIHKQNITHRDLKPDNMLLDNKGHLKLADFGLSNTLEQHHVKQEVAEKVDHV